MEEDALKIKALFIAPNAEEKYGVSELLLDMGYDVFCRDSQHQGLTLLPAINADLLVLSFELDGTNADELCRTLRNDPGFDNLKIVVVGEDPKDGRNAIAALEAGADDFVAFPFPERLFRARVQRLTRKNKAQGSTLSVTVEGNELPGILSFLEAEIKTGRLEVRHGKTTVMVYLFEGRLVNGDAPGCEGLDAVVEALCFPNSHVTFHEEDVPEDARAFSLETTGTIMNCVFEVDEFHEAQNMLPRDDAQFKAGKPLPDDADERQKKMAAAALDGMTVSAMLSGLDIGERHATMTLHRLIENEHLEVLPGPFSHYLRSTHDYFAKRSTKFLERRLSEIRTSIDAIPTPIQEPSGKVGFSNVNWMSPAPKFILLGDNPQHVKMLVHAFELLHIAVEKARPMTRKVPGNARATRLHFGDKREIDLMVLPPRLGPAMLHWNDIAEDAFAVILLCSSQDDDAIQQLTKTVRKLRKNFTGIYYFVVPQVEDQFGNPTFKISCKGCGFTLSADVRYTGAEGECPICNASFAFPDCLDHLADRLFLPNDVPVIQLNPTFPNQAADLLRLIIDSLHQANQPLPAPGETSSAPAATIEKTAVRERTIVETPPEAEEVVSPVPEDPPEVAAADPEHYYEEAASVQLEKNSKGARDALDDLLDGGIFAEDSSTGSDDFDLDEFIRSANKR